MAALMERRTSPAFDIRPLPDAYNFFPSCSDQSRFG